MKESGVNLKKILLLTILLVFIIQNIYSESEFSGYYENRFFLIFNTGSIENSNNKIQTGDYNRLRLILKSTPAKKVRINIKTLGLLSLGDRYDGDIKFEKGILVIGKDRGLFSKRNKPKERRFKVS